MGTEYDRIADIYDMIHQDPESLKENRQVMRKIGPVNGEVVLDIGCGTGLFMDYNPDVKNYHGIDPSLRMLQQFIRKHENVNLTRCKFEDCFTFLKFDLIVCLFGSANYIKPHALRRIPRLLSNKGRYFVMLYKPGYCPVTYERSGIVVARYYHDKNILPGEVTELNSFYIIQGSRNGHR